jgi:hypothetical protein
MSHVFLLCGSEVARYKVFMALFSTTCGDAGQHVNLIRLAIDELFGVLRLGPVKLLVNATSETGQVETVPKYGLRLAKDLAEVI